MDFNYAYNLDDLQIAEIKGFCNSLDECCVEQFPEWEKVIEDAGVYTHFIAKENGNIVGYAKMHVTSQYFKSGSILYGPLFLTKEILIDFFDHIYTYCKSNSFMQLYIQLGFRTSSISDYVEFVFNKKYKIKSNFDKYNWSSLALLLDGEPEQLINKYSYRHRRDIKKNIDSGIHSYNTSQQEDIVALSTIFDDLYKKRKLAPIYASTKKIFLNIKDFILKNGKGCFVIVKNKDGKILGGLIGLYQGDNVRYFRGATDPNARESAILHSGIHQLALHAQKSGFKYLDLWGYNHFVDSSDQIFNVNLFKKGFTKNYIFYPKRMLLVTQPFKYFLYKKIYKYIVSILRK